MRITSQLFIAAFTLLALTTSAHAQSQREQLNQMVQQLQKTPGDDALREKTIRLGMKVRPAVPDAAEKFEGRAKFAFKNAKSTADYADAAREYEKAVQTAPWIAGYYSDLCTIYEKAGQYADAKRNCEVYVKTLVDRSQISETKQRIAGLEFGIEKAKQQAVVDTPEAREAALLKKVEGAKFVARHTPENLGLKPGTMAYDEIFEIKDRTLHITFRIHYITSGSVYGHRQPGEYLGERISYRDGAFTQTLNNGQVAVIRIKPDGQGLTRQYNNAEYKFEIPRN